MRNISPVSFELRLLERIISACLDCSQFKRNRRNNSHFAEKKRSWNHALKRPYKMPPMALKRISPQRQSTTCERAYSGYEIESRQNSSLTHMPKARNTHATETKWHYLRSRGQEGFELEGAERSRLQEQLVPLEPASWACREPPTPSNNWSTSITTAWTGSL